MSFDVQTRISATLAALVIGVAPGASGASAQIVGSVIDDSKGSGVAGATVTVFDEAGDSLSAAVARGDGEFGLAWADGSPGRYSLRVEALGYSGVSTPIDYEGVPLLVEIRITPAPVELAGLEVRVEPRSAYLDRHGYYDRKRRGFGRFLDRGSMPEYPVIRASRLVERMPGVRTFRGDEPFFSRAQGMRLLSGARCYPVVVVDDFVLRRASSPGSAFWYDFEDLVPNPEMVEAIEAYPFTSWAPPQWRFTDNNCGVIAVWTRRG